MARINATISLFTIFLFSLLVPLAGPAFGADLPLDVERLSFLQEPKNEVERASRFQYADLDCRFLDRIEIAERIDLLAKKRKAENNLLVADAENTNLEIEETCPVELHQSAAGRLERLKFSANGSIEHGLPTKRASWANSVVLAADLALRNRELLSQSAEWSKHQLESFFEWSIENSNEAVATSTPKTSFKKAGYVKPIRPEPLEIPVLVIPAKRELHKLEPIRQKEIPVWWIKATTESEEDGIEEAFEPNTPAIEDESGRDPYWQYYEDCDRWGVEFAKLLHDADYKDFQTSVPTRNRFHIAFVSFEEKIADNDSQPNVSRTKLPITKLILKVVVDQNPAWLNTIPKMADFYSLPISKSAYQFALDSEFIEVESRMINEELIHVKAMSPMAQAFAIHDLVSERSIAVLAKENLTEFDFSILSCYICEAQSNYSDLIATMLERSHKAKLVHRLRMQEEFASRIENLGFRCFQIADSIRWFQTDDIDFDELR